MTFRDLRQAVRALASAPGFTVVVLGVLTLGLGASVAIFSVVDATVLRGLPFDRADRLVAVGGLDVTSGVDGYETPQDFLDWRDQQDVLTGLAASAFGGISLKREGRAAPETLVSSRVTAGLFEVLHVSPIIGRTFTRADETTDGSGLAVISYGLWQRRFGGRADVVGASLPGQLRTFEVIGVMPRGFEFPVADIDPTEVWVPIVFSAADRQRGTDYNRVLHVIGRLRDGVSIGTARARMAAITASLAVTSPRWFEGSHVRVEPLQTFLASGVRTWMVLLLGAVGCVLLIACVNVANLLLARATARERELRIRAALGGSRWDLARVLLAESLVLSIAGTALGVLAASSSLAALRSMLPADVPSLANIAINVRVLLAAAAAALATGIGCGLVPVWHVARLAQRQGLAESARALTASAGRLRLRGALVALEVALASVLLVGAGLFLTSFARVTSIDLGFDYHDVLTMQVRPLEMASSPAEVALMTARHRAAFDAILERVRAIPGVDAAALVGQLPLGGGLVTEGIVVPGQRVPAGEDVEANRVSPNYLLALRIPLLEGRGFTDADRQGSQPVVILNAAAARAYFPGIDPLGQVVEFSGRPWTVIGIVGDIRRDGPEAPPRRQSYRPLAQTDFNGATVVVRTSRDAAAMTPLLRTAVWSQFPDVPLLTATPLEQYLRALLAPRRLNMWLLTLFGGLGVGIAAAGIYGVTSFVVAQRTKEIGIRLALGAQPAAVWGAVVLGASRDLALGLAVGLFGAWLLAALVQRFLFSVSAHAIGVYAVACFVLVTIGILAAFLPARRASHLDPWHALRVE